MTDETRLDKYASYISRECVKNPLLVERRDPKAELPFKQNISDVGWDLTLIERTDKRNEDDIGSINMFRTGLVVSPPLGYHVEIYARSSLQKLGYMLGNSVGIIDPEYRGEVLIGLYKFREGADLELPCRGVQMILRKTEYGRLASSDNISIATSRGDLGFGSTGGYSSSEKDSSKGTKPQLSSGRKKQTNHFS